jgi:hypothetical protein
MVMGRYPAAADGQLISRAWIKRARDNWDNHVAKHGIRPFKGLGKPIQGLDVAEMGKDSSVSCMRYGDYIAPLISWGNSDVHETARRAADLHKQYDCEITNVDGNGFGAGVAPIMVEWDLDAYGVKVQSRPTHTAEEGEFDRMRDQLWWLLRCWLRHTPTAMLPPDFMLEEELATPTYLVDRGKIKIMRKEEMREKLRRSPDRAEALMLTFFGDNIKQEDLLGPLGFAVYKHSGK